MKIFGGEALTIVVKVDLTQLNSAVQQATSKGYTIANIEHTQGTEVHITLALKGGK